MQQSPSFKYPVHDMARPQPASVWPQGSRAAVDRVPTDAVRLFDGSGLGSWVGGGGKPAGWTVEDGVLAVKPGTGDIQTKESFGDVQMHIEWMVPEGTTCSGQKGCNSGVFFMGMYELQILNSNGNETYPDGMAGALYGQYPPMVNACLPLGQWNTYDIVFRAPRFKADGSLESPAYMTVIFNGVLVQDHVAMLGRTAHAARATYAPHEPKGPIRLQDHGDPIRFRNIWVRNLPAPQVAE
ncbi:MAG: DUF1080 domain-containing protein [Phycisphaerales bacterium]|nr:DUF1080 domain-containing protein [Phycisphaerales bacterium]